MQAPSITSGLLAALANMYGTCAAFPHLVPALLLAPAAAVLATLAALAAACAALLAVALSAVHRRRLLRHIPAAAAPPPLRHATPWHLGDVPHFGPMSPPFRTAHHIAALAAASAHPMVTYRF